MLVQLGSLVRKELGISEPSTDLETDLELWLTYLSQDHPWLSEAENLRNHAQLLDLSTAVGHVLARTIREVVAQPSPSWLLPLVSHWHDSNSVVLTLNYDTLVERVASGIECGVGNLPTSALYP